MLVSAGTILGLAGTDLVLPAVPGLPAELGGSQAVAQLVLAAYVCGVALGFVVFGELGAHVRQGRLVAVALGLFGAVSLAAFAASDLRLLVGLRFFQGLFGSAAAVFAPVWIRLLFEQRIAVRALGALASIESLTPAVAPVIGLWLLSAFVWWASFTVLGLGGVLLACLAAALSTRLPTAQRAAAPGGYVDLLRNRQFVQHGVSHACTLGGLLIFVFGMPAVFTKAFGGELADFVILQVTGITFFVIASNGSGFLVDRLGSERTILAGSLISALGAGLIWLYAAAGGTGTVAVTALFVLVNLGLGVRGPPGFFGAIAAAEGNESRAVAVILLSAFLIVGAGTALAAPHVETGLAALAAITFAVSVTSPVLLLALRSGLDLRVQDLRT